MNVTGKLQSFWINWKKINWSSATGHEVEMYQNILVEMCAAEQWRFQKPEKRFSNNN